MFVFVCHTLKKALFLGNSKKKIEQQKVTGRSGTCSFYFTFEFYVTKIPKFILKKTIHSSDYRCHFPENLQEHRFNQQLSSVLSNLAVLPTVEESGCFVLVSQEQYPVSKLKIVTDEEKKTLTIITTSKNLHQEPVKLTSKNKMVLAYCM